MSLIKSSPIYLRKVAMLKWLYKEVKEKKKDLEPIREPDKEHKQPKRSDPIDIPVRTYVFFK